MFWSEACQCFCLPVDLHPKRRLFNLFPESWRSLISPPVAGAVPCRYPNTACELLTCDVPQINDRLGGDEALLNLLYDFLDHEPPLNPLLASFFSKTIGSLIARKTEQVKRPPCLCGRGGWPGGCPHSSLPAIAARLCQQAGDSVPGCVVGLSGAVWAADL